MNSLFGPIGAVIGMSLIFIVFLKFYKGGLLWDMAKISFGTPNVIRETSDGHELMLNQTERVSEGLYSTENGDYIETPKSVKQFFGIPTMITTSQRAWGIPLKFAYYTKWLRKERDINDGEELESYIVNWLGNNENEWRSIVENDDSIGDDTSLWTDEKINRDILNLVYDGTIEIPGLNMSKALIGDGETDVTYSEFNDFITHAKLPEIDLAEFNRFVKHNIRPGNIRARVNKRVQEVRDQSFMENMGFMTWIGIGLCIMFIGVAYAISQGYLMG